MNKGAVSSARVAHVHRQALRRRGAALVLDALNSALVAGVGHRGPYSQLLGADFKQVALAAYRAIKPSLHRESRLQQRRNAFYATRLARANGWGSAGLCPAGHDAKKPAARTRVCRVAGGVAHTSLPACKTVQRPMVGVSDES